MLNEYFIKSRQQSTLPWTELVQNKFSVSFNNTTGHDSKLNLSQTDTEICEKLSHTTVTLKVKVTPTDNSKCRG